MANVAYDFETIRTASGRLASVRQRLNDDLEEYWQAATAEDDYSVADA